MTIPANVLSIIWDELESTMPSVGAPGLLWPWYYQNYSTLGETQIVESTQYIDYWETMANLFLLILLSEGHSI